MSKESRKKGIASKQNTREKKRVYGRRPPTLGLPTSAMTPNKNDSYGATSNERSPKNDRGKRPDNNPLSLREKIKLKTAAKKTSSSKKMKVAKAAKDRDASKHQLASKSRRGIISKYPGSMVQKSSTRSTWDANNRKSKTSGTYDEIIRSKTKAPKKKKGKKKILEFKMTLSECNDDLFLFSNDVPWHKAENQERFRRNFSSLPLEIESSHRKHAGFQHRKSSAESDRASRDSYNGGNTLQFPSEAVLCQIDAEIQSFGAYVKLTPSEVSARAAFLTHIETISLAQFSTDSTISASSKIQRAVRYSEEGSESEINDGKNKDIQVAPFGSFATQEVCTFASDVDMCVWGVVKEEKKTAQLEFFGGKVDVESESDDEFGLETDGNSDCHHVIQSCDGCPILTESSLLRTMDAIQASAIARSDKMGIEYNYDQSKKATFNSNDDGKALVASRNNYNDSLFVIDRVGEDAGESNESKDLKLPVRTGLNEHRKSDDILKLNTKKDLISKKKSSSPPPDFQFAADVDGMAQLGGGFDEQQNYLNNTDNGNVELQLDEGSRRNIVKVFPGGIKNLDQLTENENSNVSKCKDPPGTIDLSREDCDAYGAETSLVSRTKDSKNVQSNEFEPGVFSSLGKSVEDAIDVDDGSNSCNSVNAGKDNAVFDEEDNDSADKMSSYYSRQKVDNCLSSIDLLNGESVLSELKIEFQDHGSDESLSSKEEKTSESVLELSLTANHTNKKSGMAHKAMFGPTGGIRIRVVSALQRLTAQLRRSSFTHTIECRSKARVPIINCSTRTGFEGDIAIGGHNGVDTSMYAMMQVNRFRSFAPIVLLLKLTMVQQSLDKPFTGGLGSYKLYVLVSYHIECHLANGGSDRPSEILISLLYRYGCMRNDDDAVTTNLVKLRNSGRNITCDGGTCDLSPIFRMNDCIAVFRECYQRLLDRVVLAQNKISNSNGRKISYLSSFIDCYRLRDERERSDSKSKLWQSIIRPIAHDDPGKVSAGRRIGKVFSKHEHSNFNDFGGRAKRRQGIAEQGLNKKSRTFNDAAFTSTSMKSFNRGPRGGIIPSWRPDYNAMNQLRSDQHAGVLQRGLKNRKNKKKQARDCALKSFATHNVD